MLQAASPENLDFGGRLYEALALLLIAIVVSVTNRINNKPIKRKLEQTNQKLESNNQKFEETSNTVTEVNNTLTKNNGGSSVKDSLDKIMRTQEVHGLQFKYLESQQDNIQAKQDRLESKQDRMDEKVDRTDAKLDAVDKKVNSHIHEGLGRKLRGKK